MSTDEGLPDRFQGYRRETRLESGFRSVEKLRQKLGCLLLVLIGVGVGCGIYYRGSPVAISWIIGATLATIVVLSVCLSWLRSRTVPKQPFPCTQCGTAMSIVDLPFPQEELEKPDGYGLSRARFLPSRTSFQGADGHIYQYHKFNSQGPGYDYVIYRLFQHWNACEKCCVCFLAEPRSYQGIANVREEFEAELIRARLTGEDKETNRFLRELEGGDADEKPFLERLAGDDEPPRS